MGSLLCATDIKLAYVVVDLIIVFNRIDFVMCNLLLKQISFIV